MKTNGLQDNSTITIFSSNADKLAETMESFKDVKNFKFEAFDTTKDPDLSGPDHKQEEEYYMSDKHIKYLRKVNPLFIFDQ